MRPAGLVRHAGGPRAERPAVARPATSTAASASDPATAEPARYAIGPDSTSAANSAPDAASTTAANSASAICRAEELVPCSFGADSSRVSTDSVG